MGSAVSITANILAVGDNFSYLLCNPAQTKAIDCSKATVKGQWWFEPYLCAQGICYRKWSSLAEAGASGIQAVEVQMEDGESLYLNGALDDYTAKCNSCCGSTPSLSPITIPPYIPCVDVCPDADGNEVISWLIKTLYSGQSYTVSLYINNTLVTTSGALTSPAAVLDYAQANWAAQGTWTLNGNILTLTSTDISCAALVVTPVSHSFCITVAYPFTFDQIKRSGDNGITDTIDLPVARTVGSNAELASALTSPNNYFSDGAITHAIAGKVQYAGPGRPITLLNNGSVVGTWTTAACS